MEKNDIKKALYREKPEAKFRFHDDGSVARKGVVLYESELDGGHKVLFEVKVADMGDAPLHQIMEGHLLIRYLS